MSADDVVTDNLMSSSDGDDSNASDDSSTAAVEGDGGIAGYQFEPLRQPNLCRAGLCPGYSLLQLMP